MAVKEFGSLTSREWRILASVRHPHICSLVDHHCYVNNRVHTTKIVVEYMDGSLQGFMSSSHPMTTSHKGKKAPAPTGTGAMIRLSPPGSPLQQSCLGALAPNSKRQDIHTHLQDQGLGVGGGATGSPLTPLGVEMAREVLYAIALALDYLHHKLIVHLDVKLDNILVREPVSVCMYVCMRFGGG